MYDSCQPACLLVYVGYDGVSDLLPSLLELIRSKVYGTDIPPVPSQIAAAASQSDENMEPVGVAHCTEFMSVAEADGIVTNLEQSSSAWYHFSAGLCSKCVKPPSSRGQVEYTQLDGQAAQEHIVAVNGFAEH